VDHHDFAAAINIIHRKVTANNHNEIDSLRLNNTSTGLEKTNKRPFRASSHPAPARPAAIAASIALIEPPLSF
jgi:hypothetical protein